MRIPLQPVASAAAAIARSLQRRIWHDWAMLAARSPRAWWAVPFLSFTLLSAIVFINYADTLFYRYDGTFILTMTRSQSRWMAPGAGFSLNFLQGLGDVWIPTATAWVPGFLLGSLFSDHWLPVIACLVFAMEFFLATLLLARTFQADRGTAVGAAWLSALVVLPFFVPTIDDWRLWGNPHFLSAIAANTIVLCAFVQIGRADLSRDLAAGLVALVLLVYLLLGQPVRAAIAAPMLAFFSGAAIIAARTPRERLYKIVAAAVLAGGLGICFGGYLLGLFWYARTTYFWQDLAGFPVSWKEQSFIISEGRGYGPYIWFACLAGAALAALRQQGAMRHAAIAFLAFVAIQQLIFLVGAITGFVWRGPTLAYVDMFALPFYALFGAYLMVGWWGEHALRRGRVIVTLALAAWVVLLTLHKPYADTAFRSQNPFLWPPRETAITRHLRTEIGLSEGGLFRGRVISIAGTEFEQAYAWVPLVSQHNYDAAVSFHIGNDHRYYGMWYFDIPTLIADNQFATPFAHVMNSRLFARPSEKHVRQLTTLTRSDRRLVGQMGVRFVLTSRPLPGLQPAASILVVPGHEAVWTQYLYEVPDAKVAGYWSTRPRQVATVRQALLQLTAKAPTDADASIYEAMEAPLVSGRSSELRTFRDRLVVSAESPGTSLLVLPVEFSHCFDVQVLEGAQARLLRANVNQSALLFSGRVKVELRYRYSPWHFRCRFRDIDDVRTLKLTEVGWPD